MKKSRVVALAATFSLATSTVVASVLAVPAHATPAECALAGPITFESSCFVAGTLGSGATVSIKAIVVGAGGGSGGDSDYQLGGRGAHIETSISVPAGSELTVVPGTGGGMGGPGSGGGSTAVLLNGTLLVEAGGGGGAALGDGTQNPDRYYGADAAANNTPAGGNGPTSCGGSGGNSLGTGNGGAGGATSCETGPEFLAGSAGAAASSGGAGGDGGGTVVYEAGGAGYSPGGASMSNDTGFNGGAGGGGGYGGGGGGAGVIDTNNSSSSVGGGGGGGSFAHPTMTAGTTYQPSQLNDYGYPGDDSDGGPGAVIFLVDGPAVKTEQSAPTGITTTGATTHSMVNAAGTDTTVKVRYSKSADLSSGVAEQASTPSTVSSVNDENVSTTLSGLESCSTYYYQVSATQSILRPDGIAVGVAPMLEPSEPEPEPEIVTTLGEIASFKTACETKLPLTVKGRAAGKALPRSGSTTVVSKASTSNKGTVKAIVRCKIQQPLRGDLSYCDYRVTGNKKKSVVVTTKGYKNVVVTVALVAVPKSKYKGEVKRSTLWKQSWSVK